MNYHLFRAAGYNKGTRMMDQVVEDYAYLTSAEQFMMGMLAKAWGSAPTAMFVRGMCQNGYTEPERSVLLLIALSVEQPNADDCRSLLAKL